MTKEYESEKAVWLEMLNILSDREFHKISPIFVRKTVASMCAKGMVEFVSDHAISVVLKRMRVKEVIPGKMWMKSENVKI